VLFTPSVYRGTDHVEIVAALRQDLPRLEHHLVVEDPTVAPTAFAGWLDSLPDCEPLLPVEAAGVSELLFTSGTESRPKAVMHTEQTATFSSRTTASSLGLTDADVVWAASPIGHSTGFNFGLRVALHHGLPLVLQDRWDAATAATLVEQHGITYAVAATTFVSDMVRQAEADSGPDLSSLRLFGSGGAAVPPEVVEAAARHGMNVLRLYGSTEALVATWNRPGDPAERRMRTDGPPLDQIEVQVRAEDGRAVVGEPGEILVRGPNTCVGFFDDPERTAATFAEDGWVRSGDLGVLDEDGYLTVVGRSKEIVIRGGLNIAPRELEELVGAHPAVAEVAVVGLPHPRLGEQACACVVVEPGATLELEELVAFLRQGGTAAYKLPEHLELVEELPRTSTGKVQKFKLVERIGERDAG
jgi:acyl-CoA synthetase (AMP-forming)/AMP-acid ligase II